MLWQLNGILEISLPEDWQAVTFQGGTALVRTADLASAGSVDAVHDLSLFVSLLAQLGGESPSDLIEQLMARRVRQGYPGRFRDQVAGVSLQGFDWTDGIRDVISLFARLADGSVVELLASRAWVPGAYQASLRDSAKPLLARVRWLGKVAEPQLWAVWRQDDNGNRALVSTGHTQDQADGICATIEARGHKQLYWTAPAGDDAG